MSTSMIVGWVFVAVLTGINIFVFLKLKQSAEQMLKMAFPGAKDMNEAMSKMQQMMKGMGGLGGLAAAGRAPGKGGTSDAQVKAAMEMLQKMQTQKGGKR